MHRETTISREIKLLKNKFELLEKNRQFRSILQKSSNNNASDMGELDSNNDHISNTDYSRTRSEATSEGTLSDSAQMTSGAGKKSAANRKSGRKSVRIKTFSKLSSMKQLISPMIRPLKTKLKNNNKVASIDTVQQSSTALSEGDKPNNELESAITQADGLAKSDCPDGKSNLNHLPDLSATNQEVSTKKKKKRGGLFGFFKSKERG